MDMEETFGSRLRYAMEEKGLTASQLSRLSGVDKSAISNYLNGKYLAKQDKVYLLATALGVNPGWLMTGVEQEEPQDREFTIFVPSPNFVKMVKYMSQEDYENVVKAFEHAYEKMKQLGVSLDD